MKNTFTITTTDRRGHGTSQQMSTNIELSLKDGKLAEETIRDIYDLLEEEEDFPINAGDGLYYTTIEADGFRGVLFFGLNGGGEYLAIRTNEGTYRAYSERYFDAYYKPAYSRPFVEYTANEDDDRLERIREDHFAGLLTDEEIGEAIEILTTTEIDYSEDKGNFYALRSLARCIASHVPDEEWWEEETTRSRGFTFKGRKITVNGSNRDRLDCPTYWMA